MKIRYGFVSNSSSSSFTCMVSGETESGWDIGLQDAEMVECVNGHTFSQQYVIGGERTIDKFDDEGSSDYDEDWRYYLPAEYCPICQMQYITKGDMNAYLIKRYAVESETIKAEIRERFKDYKDLRAFIRGVE